MDSFQASAGLARVLVLLAASVSFARGTFTAEQKKALVVSHNKLRQAADPQASNMNFVTWSCKLEALAVKAAEKCVHNQHYTDGEYSGLGQNIYASSGTAISDVSDITNAWHTEKAHMLGPAPSVYDGTGKHCATGKVCGHYTQLMLAAVTEIGCGSSTRCPGAFKTVVYCQYNKGQMGGQPMHALGTSCSACPKETPSCHNNRCLTPALAASPGGGAGADSSFECSIQGGGSDEMVTTKSGGRLMQSWQLPACLMMIRCLKA